MARSQRRLGFEPLEWRRVMTSISGQVWHDLDGNGAIDTGEPGLTGWQVFLDSNDNGRFDNGEPVDLTDANGDYAFTGLTPGFHRVGQIVQSGFQQIFPPNNARQTVQVGANSPVTNLVFGNKRTPIPFSEGNVLVTRSSFLDDDLLIEYTRAGEIVQAFVVPGTEGFSRILAKDLTIDDTGKVRIFTKDDAAGTPEEVLLTTYDPVAKSFSNTTVAGWDVTSATNFAGSIAAFGSFLYVNDHLEGGNDSGVIRFATSDVTQPQRFQSGFGEPGHVTIGRDGNLYTMSATLTTTTLSAYDPDTMEFQRSLTISQPLRRFAVDDAGHVFATTDTGVKHFDASGSLLATTLLVSGQDIEIGADGTLLLTDNLKVEMIDRNFTAGSKSGFTLPGNVSVNLTGFATFVEPPLSDGGGGGGGGDPMTGVFTNGNILVSNSPTADVPKLYEYTPFGQLVQEFAIPVVDGGARDLVVDRDGDVQIFNGTFDPRLTTFTSATPAFGHIEFAGWNTADRRTFGGAAAYDKYVFLSDTKNGDDADSERGIVRYDIDAGTFERFHADLGETIDVAIGLNGLLYTLIGTTNPIGTQLREYNPLTLQLIRTLSLPSQRAIAVDVNGDIFAVHSQLSHFDKNGVLQGALDLHGLRGLADIDIDSDGRLLVAASDGQIAVTDRTLASVVTFPTRTSDGYNFAAFVSPSRGLPKANWDVLPVDEDSSGNVLDVLANDVGNTGTTLTLSAVSTPDRGGSVSLQGNTQLTYTPAADFVGDETFTYTITDGLGGTDVGHVTMRVKGSAPFTVGGDRFSLNEDDMLDVPAFTGLLANDGSLDVFPVLTQGNILVADASPVFGESSVLQEYSPAGVLVRSIDVPDFTGGFQQIRDLVVDLQGHVQIYNGTFTPRLTTYDATANSLTHAQFANWNTANNTTYGGMAAWKNFIYATDSKIVGENDQQLGIVRWDVRTGQGQRFPDKRTVGNNMVDVDFIDLAVGQDGFLYALGGGGTPTGTYIRVYNPSTMQFIREIALPRENRAIAVADNGDIYAIDFRNPNIYQYDRNGVLRRTFNTGLGAAAEFSDIDLHQNGRDLLLANTDFILNGDVVLTTTAFTPIQRFVAPNRRSSMKFAAWIQPPVDSIKKPLSVVSHSPASHGVATVAADGAFTYVPDPDYVGTDSFTYVVVDGDGQQGIGTVTLTVDPVNDSPLLVPSGPMRLTDENSPIRTPLPAIINGRTGTTTITDVDETDNVGNIAVVGSAGPGSWAYSVDGTIFIDIGTVSDDSALLLPRGVEVRFTPAGSAGGVAALTYRAWDETQGLPLNRFDTTFEVCLDMSMVDAMGFCADGSLPVTMLHEAFSAATDTLTITLGEVNDAPILAPSNPSFGITDEHTPHTAAPLDFITNVFDPDTSAGVEGIALSAATGRGLWQYSLDGTNFLPLPALSEAAALLLNADSRLRYTPDQLNGEKPTLTYRAWDKSDGGTAGAFGNSAIHGGRSAYSAARDTATLTVSSVNDAPVLSPGFPDLGTTDAATPVTLFLFDFVTGVSDVDLQDPVGGVAVTGVTGDGTWSYSINGTSFTPFPGVTAGNALLLRPTDRLRYTPLGPLGETPNLSYQAWDGSSGIAGNTASAVTNGGTTAFSTASDTATLTVNEVNDPPVLTGPSPPVDYTENDPATRIDPLLTVADVDSSNFLDGALTVSILTNKSAADKLTVQDGNGISVVGGNVLFSSGGVDRLVGTLSGGNNGSDLVVQFTAAGADSESVQALTRAVAYEHTSDNPLGSNRVIRFAVTDGDHGNDTGSINKTVNITAVNDRPIANTDAYSVFTGGTLSVSSAFGLLVNDLDLEGSPLTARQIVGPIGGTLSLNANGSFTYTPRVTFFGIDGFTYVANDGVLDSAIITVQLNVNLPHRNPSHPADVNGDGFLSAIDPLLIANRIDRQGPGVLPLPPASPPFYDFNGDGNATQSDVAGATASVNTPGPRELPDPKLVVAGTPPALGSAEFVTVRLAATDLSGQPITSINVGDSFFLQTLVRDISGVPRGVAAAYLDVLYDTNLVGVLSQPVFSNAYPVFRTGDASVLGLLDEFGAGNTTQVLGGNEVLLFQVPFTATGRGTARFTSDPADLRPLSDTLLFGFDGPLGPQNIRFGTFDLNILGPPAAIDDDYATGEDRALNVAAADGVLKNDFDDPGDTFTAMLDTTTSHGSLTFRADGSFDYVPNSNFFGTDSFTYTATDGQFTSPPATVTIEIAAENDPPVAAADAYRMTLNRTLTIAALDGVLVNDRDADGDPLTAVRVLGSGPANGTLTLNASGAFSYTPTPGFVGTDSFSYQARDDRAATGTATVTIDVVYDWRNHTHAVDVNGDGFASPIDAAWIFNDLLALGPRSLPQPPLPGNEPPPFLDFNGNGSVSNFDGQKVLEDLNASGSRPLPQPRLQLPQSPADLAANDTVTFNLQVTNLLGQPATSFEVGDTLLLNVSVSEQVLAAQGVFAAYLDVAFNAALAAVSGATVFDAAFANVRTGNTATPGLLDEIGAAYGSTPPQLQPQRLFSVPFTATAPGTLTFTGNAADVLPAGDVVLFGVQGAVPASNLRFNSASVTIILTDRDTDGVGDRTENQAPNGGDGNRDGTRDGQQAHVASFPSGDDSHYVTIAANPQTQLRAVASVANPSPGTAPANVDFPAGTFEFEIGGLSPGGATVVTIFLEPGVVANTYYRFGPTPANATPHWYPFLFNGETGAKIFSDRIEVHLVDGKLGDNDLTKNGIIRDPAAPGFTAHPWQNPLTPEDVDNNGVVASLDVLALVNEINANGTRELPAVPAPGDSFPPFFDVDGNDQLSAADVLVVVNYINAGSSQGPLPEPEGFSLDLWPADSIPTRRSQRSSAAAPAAIPNPAPRPADALRRDDSSAANSAANVAVLSSIASVESDDLESALNDLAADINAAWRDNTEF